MLRSTFAHLSTRLRTKRVLRRGVIDWHLELNLGRSETGTSLRLEWQHVGETACLLAPFRDGVVRLWDAAEVGLGVEAHAYCWQLKIYKEEKKWLNCVCCLQVVIILLMMSCCHKLRRLWLQQTLSACVCNMCLLIESTNSFHPHSSTLYINLYNEK